MRPALINGRGFDGLWRDLAGGRIAMEHAEMVFLLFGLTLTFGTFRQLLGSGDIESGNPVNQALLSLVGLGSLFLMVWRGVSVRRTLRAARSLLPLFALVGLCYASLAWSIDPDVTLRRLIALTFSTFFTLYVITRFDLRTFLTVAAVAFLIAEVVGILAAGLPGYGITPSGVNAGGWRGFTGQKNEFGGVMAMALLLFARPPKSFTPSVRRLWLPLVILGAALLLLSDSKTSLIATVVGLVGGVFWRMVLSPHRMHFVLRMLIAALVLSIIPLTIFYLVPLIVEGVGRDLTFSGRQNIWEFVILMNEDRQWLGAGYRAFWTEQNTAYFFDFFWWYDPFRDAFTHSHSSYMDVWGELGWVGIGALAFLLTAMLVKIRDAYAAGDYLLGDLMGSVLTFALVYSYTARFFLVYFDTKWLILSVLYGYGALALARSRDAVEAALATPPPVSPASTGLGGLGSYGYGRGY